MEKKWEMKEIANDYLIDEWKALPPCRILRSFLLYAHRSWSHAVSRRTLSFIVRVSHPAIGNTPLKRKTFKIIFFKFLVYLLLKVLEFFNRLTTIVFYPHNRCGTKKKKQDYKIKRKYIWLSKKKIKTQTQQK